MVTVQADFYSANNVDQALIDRADVPFYAFNEYIQIGVESGVLGLILFLALMVVVLMRAYRNKQYGVMGALVSLGVFAFFSYPFSVLPFLIVLVTLLALGQVGQADKTVYRNHSAYYRSPSDTPNPGRGFLSRISRRVI